MQSILQSCNIIYYFQQVNFSTIDKKLSNIQKISVFNIKSHSKRTSSHNSSKTIITQDASHLQPNNRKDKALIWINFRRMVLIYQMRRCELESNKDIVHNFCVQINGINYLPEMPPPWIFIMNNTSVLRTCI